MLQRRSGKERSDVQVWTLDDTLNATTNKGELIQTTPRPPVVPLEETFRRENGSEILEITHSTLADSISNHAEDDGDVSFEHSHRSRQVRE